MPLNKETKHHMQASLFSLGFTYLLFSPLSLSRSFSLILIFTHSLIPLPFLWSFFFLLYYFHYFFSPARTYTHTYNRAHFCSHANFLLYSRLHFYTFSVSHILQHIRSFHNFFHDFLSFLFSFFLFSSNTFISSTHTFVHTHTYKHTHADTLFSLLRSSLLSIIPLNILFFPDLFFPSSTYSLISFDNFLFLQIILLFLHHNISVFLSFFLSSFLSVFLPLFIYSFISLSLSFFLCFFVSLFLSFSQSSFFLSFFLSSRLLSFFLFLHITHTDTLFSFFFSLLISLLLFPSVTLITPTHRYHTHTPTEKYTFIHFISLLLFLHIGRHYHRNLFDIQN